MNRLLADSTRMEQPLAKLVTPQCARKRDARRKNLDAQKPSRPHQNYYPNTASNPTLTTKPLQIPREEDRSTCPNRLN